MHANPQAARYQEIKVRTATPTELVVMMYDSAIAALEQARQHIRARDIGRRVRCLNKASSILTELQAALNFEAGGEIARSLDRLYAYMRRRLFEANLHQDGAAVEEVVKLLANLRPAWAAVAQAEAARARGDAERAAATAAPQPAAPAAALSGLSVTA
jgi:flagellar protein FliS